MKIFSLTFILDSEKRKIIGKELKKKKRKFNTKKALIIFIILIISGYFVWTDSPQMGASFFSIFALPYVLINVFALNENRKSEYKLFNRSTVFTLYEDRIEITDNPTEDYKGTFERVYPVSAVTEITDYPQFIIVHFDNSDRQFVMKSDITNEQLNLLTSKTKKA